MKGQRSHLTVGPAKAIPKKRRRLQGFKPTGNRTLRAGLQSLHSVRSRLSVPTRLCDILDMSLRGGLMKENRRHQRFDVSGFPELKAGTKNGPIGERLLTISQGGCGFWAPHEDFRLRIGEKVEIHLYMGELSPDTRVVRGEILYILPHPIDSHIGRSYGVRFREEDLSLVSEIMLYLDGHLDGGRIKISV